jgi:hypothetical protein
MRGVALVLTAAVVLGAGACTRANPDYCDATNDHCAASGRVCNAQLNVCEAPGPKDGGAEGGAHDAAPPDAAPECVQSTDCTDLAKPICVGGACGACTGDAQCAARDVTTPACASGRCVECTAAGHCTTTGRPLCTAAHTCVPCAADAECDAAGYAPGLCVAGDCPGAGEVIWVSAANGCSSTAGGTQATPFCTVNEAITQAGAAGAPKVIVVAAATAGYGWFATNGAAVLIAGRLGGGEVVVNGDATHPAVSVKNGAVTLRRLHLHGAPSPQVALCDTATCDFDQLVVENGTIGVQAQGGATLTLTRSSIYGNAGGGIRTQMADFDVVNNFIYTNGRLTSAAGGALFYGAGNGVKTRAVNNTVWSNQASGAGAGILCQSLTGVTVANTIIWGNTQAGPALSSVAGCDEVRYSLTDDPAVAALASAHNLGPSTPPLFASDIYPFDLHLQAGSGGLGAGDPTVAPADDIDGQPRTGAIDIGADQLTQ